MDTLGIGKVIVTEQHRDAVHMAIAPVVAAERLTAATHVGFVGESNEVGQSVDNLIGIVDPFLKRQVQKGETFWLFLYPGSIVSLRHEWEHPAFGKEDAGAVADKVASEQWLRDFCSDHDCPSYESVMDVITTPGGVQLGDEEYYGKSYVDGDYIHFSGTDAHGEIPDEFWDHVEVVTGRRVKHRATYFSCSC